MRLPVIAVAALVALTATACGSSNTDNVVSRTEAGSVTVPSAPATTTTGTTSQPSSSATATVATTTTTTTSTTTLTTTSITNPDSGGAGLSGSSTASAGTPECVAADLAAAALAPNSAPDTTVVGFTLKNTSSSPCRSYGWPGIAFIDAAGSVIDVTSTRTTSDVLGATPPTDILLKPGQQASFRVVLHGAGAGNTMGCESYDGAQIIAPNDAASLRVTIPEAPVESCGSVGVSPLEPGSSGTGE